MIPAQAPNQSWRAKLGNDQTENVLSRVWESERDQNRPATRGARDKFSQLVIYWEHEKVQAFYLSKNKTDQTTTTLGFAHTHTPYFAYVFFHTCKQTRPQRRARHQYLMWLDNNNRQIHTFKHAISCKSYPTHIHKYAYCTLYIVPKTGKCSIKKCLT